MEAISTQGGARRRKYVKPKTVKKPKAVKSPRSMSPRSRGGSEEQDMDGGARSRKNSKPKAVKSPRRRGGSKDEDDDMDMEDMDGGAKNKIVKKRKLTKYQSFVKTRMCDMKKTNPELPVVEKMRRIAIEWKAR